MKFLNTLLNRTEEVLCGLALSLATSLAFIEVILRRGFGSSLGFTQEAVNYLLIFVGLIGASIGVREKVHLGVDLLVQQFSPKFQKAMIIFVYCLSILFCVIVAVLGYQHVAILLQFGQVSPEMEIPMYIPKGIVAIAFTLMTIRYLQEMIKAIKTPTDQLLAQQEEGVH
ncbi:TRAP transporter small permease [Calidifontibacillus oryziterrae]|uniref:TRAP transporter small permease n=1 Tax=Calidifontibacillus oryziterrae TaxID=1191699 RepID=UPI0003031748|nr:TRAP transporter small permease [Calidifontibacillus oryziterrae]